MIGGTGKRAQGFSRHGWTRARADGRTRAKRSRIPSPTAGPGVGARIRPAFVHTRILHLRGIIVYCTAVVDIRVVTAVAIAFSDCLGRGFTIYFFLFEN